MKIYVVIPAYEPDQRLFRLCKSLAEKGINNVVVVNDGTVSDGIFQKIAKNYPKMKILTHDKNKGKGRALKTAFAYLIENTDAEGCITADSDGQHKTEDIIKCMKALDEKPENLVLGCRRFNWDKTPFKSRIGNRFTLRYFHFKTHHRVSDTQTGLRGLSKPLMEECLSLEGERFEFEMNMLVTFANKYHITEVPIASIYHEDNSKTHFRPFKDSIRIIKTIRKASKRRKKH